jgi:hypothetical protein
MRHVGSMLVLTGALAAAAVLSLLAPTSAHAVPIVSGPGSASCEYLAGSNQAGPCSLVAITPHPAWNPTPPTPPGYGGVWVSYADTGYNGGTFQPFSNDRVIRLTIDLSFTNPVNSLDFWIWADDTADLYFNLASDPLNLVKGANFTQSTCANGSIGCQPAEYFQLVRGPLALGTYRITADFYQVGTGTNTNSNPFGLLYSGNATGIPEPATVALLGTGLLGLGMMFRRHRYEG